MIRSFADAAKGPAAAYLFEVFMVSSMGRVSDAVLEVRATRYPPRIADVARAELARRERMEAP